jgi:hypothetical protein
MSSSSRWVKGEDKIIRGREKRGEFTRFLRCFFASAAAGVCFFSFSSRIVSAAEGSLTVGFDQSQYQVGPNDSFSVSVVLPPLPNGLFSYGVQLALPQGKVQPAGSGSIVVPTPLDFNGTMGPGASRQVQADLLGVRGTVDFGAVNAAYKGVLLTTFNLKNQAGAGQTYTLTLDIYRTLGPSETVFVDGLGTDLDSLLAFGSALVVVVPEPSVAALLALPLAWKLVSGLAQKGCKA